ncbi:hypothetical protein GCM10010922_03580 [Microbacterium sorbitolivorans]|uniref:Helicase n=1 Tax=Microbacterium sorbitolivorans TaxID=1867410 RepID=A0A367Y6K0_9MICO|nr:hypothetical protein [Microbacterium sorbitolivorans]RCK61486.1 hypothetical protein DTO57_02245 [Microbacterium sorbitolivorans]GGF31769.1 hypothetical protein GCM10010922_03580 [Microbacterium sorbitolivorans]
MAPENTIWPGSFELAISGHSRQELVEQLRLAGVLLNPHADALLAHAVFDEPLSEAVRIVDRTVAELGHAAGATLPQIFAAAEEHGLSLCPPQTAPYLRLAWLDQPESADSVMSAGRAPDAALNVASPVLSDDPDFPTGFYLRVVDGQPWLRGYRCDDLYVFAPEVRFAFQQAY